jgi:hypothetical protein
VVSFPRLSHQNPVHTAPIRATCPAHLILLDFITRTLVGEEYRSLSSSVWSFLHSLRPYVKRRVVCTRWSTVAGTCISNKRLHSLKACTLYRYILCMGCLSVPVVLIHTTSPSVQRTLQFSYRVVVYPE